MKLLEPQMSSPPHLFRCPISLELFKDPVTLCTGQTYDRPFIEKWLSSGNLTCPVTMQKLTDLSLIPNLTLIHLIRQWLNQTNRSTKNYNNPSTPNNNLMSLPPNPEDRRNHEKFLSELKQTLESEEHDWTKKKKLQALKQLKSLSLELPNREDEIESLVKLGFFPVLIRLAFHEEIIGNHNLIRGKFELVELALSSAVKIMPYCELDCLNTMIKAEWALVFKRLMECGTGPPKVVISLSHFIESILSSPQTKELASVISSSGDVLRCVINLVDADDDREQVNQDKLGDCKDKDSDDEESNVMVSEAGVKIILALISTATRDGQEDNKRITVLKQLVQLGAVQSLTRCVWRGNRKKGISMVGSSKRITAALQAVEALLKVEGGKEALLGEENGVRAIVGVVFRVTTTSGHKGSENAVNCLLGLCCDSTEAIREEAVKEGVLTQLLLLLQSQCNGRTKMRARLLLKVLRGTWVTKHRLLL